MCGEMGRDWACKVFWIITIWDFILSVTRNHRSILSSEGAGFGLYMYMGDLLCGLMNSDLMNQKLGGEGPASCVSLSLPGGL